MLSFSKTRIRNPFEINRVTKTAPPKKFSLDTSGLSPFFKTKPTFGGAAPTITPLTFFGGLGNLVSTAIKPKVARNRSVVSPTTQVNSANIDGSAEFQNVLKRGAEAILNVIGSTGDEYRADSPQNASYTTQGGGSSKMPVVLAGLAVAGLAAYVIGRK